MNRNNKLKLAIIIYSVGVIISVSQLVSVYMSNQMPTITNQISAK